MIYGNGKNMTTMMLENCIYYLKHLILNSIFRRISEKVDISASITFTDEEEAIVQAYDKKH